MGVENQMAMTKHMTSRNLDTQEIGFVDTNILHYVSLYLRFANQHGLFPTRSTNDGEARVVQAIERIMQNGEEDQRTSLLSGLAFVHMARLDDIRIQFASISELELMTGRMRGEALRKAAGEGLPDRMWSKFKEREIRRRVSVEDARRIMVEVERLVMRLREVGVSVHRQDGGDDAYVIEVAKAVAGVVYMDPADCIVYSSSMVAQAGRLFTGDEYLRRTVNLIANPQERPKYVEVRRRLGNRLREVMGWEDILEVVWPKGVGVNSMRRDLKSQYPTGWGGLDDEGGHSGS